MRSRLINLPRRTFLAYVGRTGAGLTAASLLSSPLSITATAMAGTTRPATPGGDLLVQPQEIRSRAGVLSAKLTAAAGTIDLGSGSNFPGYLYNGSYLPPLLRARPGDVMRIQLRNRLPEDPSNLHFHGLRVSPRGNSDNVFIHVHPGEDFAYEVRLPPRERQGPGLFWYHPHAHGVVAKQILGGMSGGLLIDGIEESYPALKDLPERFFFIKHVERSGQEIISINGQIDPVLAIRPGEVQFWRIAHIGATLFLKFQIEGMPLYILSTDGHVLSAPRRASELFIGPGQRLDALVIGPPAGEYALRTIPFQNEAWNSPDPAQRLATVVASGAAPSAQPDEREILRQKVVGARWIDEIRTTRIARRRVLNYSRTDDRKMFMIDGRVMDEARIDQTVRFGDTEEWTIVNTDRQFHSFHIHQTAFLVSAINGVPYASDSLYDTFSIPPATELGPSSLTVVIPFTDPVILGKFVYHCHAVDHEDKGMMGIIEVEAR